MNHKDWGLQELSKAREGKNSLVLDKTINGDNVKELFKPVRKTNEMVFKDYLNRQLKMTKKTFDKHTKGYYLEAREQRDKLFPHIKQVLNSPDEVFISNYENQTFQSTYIKHFKGETIVIPVEFKGAKMIIKTWYKLKDDKISSGLLIKK